MMQDRWTPSGDNKQENKHLTGRLTATRQTTGVLIQQPGKPTTARKISAHRGQASAAGENQQDHTLKLRPEPPSIGAFRRLKTFSRSPTPDMESAPSLRSSLSIKIANIAQL